jgi:acetylglutamate kinase
MIRVVKLGGRAQADPQLPGVLARLWQQPGSTLCIVHGGGDEVSALQRRLGGEPRFVEGRRFTSPEEVDLVRMVLSGTVNKRIVRQLLVAGVPAVGISGEDGGLLPAELFEGGRLGAVGAPLAAHARVVLALFAGGFVPVISPLARDAVSGAGLNVNGDDAAAAIAIALGADELFFLIDVAGVLDAEQKVRAEIDLEGITTLVASGTAHSGMAAKLDASRRALLGGVRVVRIGDIAALNDTSLGSILSLSPLSVR